MARYSGKVGYGYPRETSPGVMEDDIVERTYFGDVVRNHRKLEDSSGIHQDIRPLNAISIVADQTAMEHFFRIKYVEWQSSLWVVASVEVRAPRLVLTLGGVYNGPTA